MTQSFRSTLSQLLKARIPILYLESYEEQRVVAEVAAVARDVAWVRTPRAVWTWTRTRGLIEPDGTPRRGSTDPEAALDAALRVEIPSVLVFQDLHPWQGSAERPGEPVVVRQLRDIASAYRTGPVARTLVLVSPVRRIPVELEKDVTIVDFPLPGAAELRAVLDGIIAANLAGGRIRIDLDEQTRDRFAIAAAGLTLHEAENAFARAMVDGILDPDDIAVVLEEKRQTVRKSGLLEFVPTQTGLADVGGLENLKRWLVKRDGSWLPEAAAYGLPAPRGVLITGVPGCGKSLTARAVSSTWELPLLRFDIGRVFAGLVGSSEQNMRTAIRTAQAVAPCILWIDEIEKGFAGGSGGDSGTSARVFGTFLTWLQEKTEAVFVIATANDFDRLPAELLRKGRFDEIFFVDLPTRAERVPIWAVHLRRRLARAPVDGQLRVDNGLLEELAGLSEGYSGAEIEQAVIAALLEAFAQRRPLRRDDLVRAVVDMVPLSVTQAERIDAIRSWADLRAVPATAAEDWDLDRRPGARTGMTDRQWPGPDHPHGGRAVEF